MNASCNVLSRREALGSLIGASVAWPFAPAQALHGDARTTTDVRLPKRVVVLSGHACAHLSVFGIRPVGVSLAGLYVEGLRKAIFGPDWRPDAIGNADLSPDAERIAALRPDLVVCASDAEHALFDGISPCITIRDFSRIADIQADLRSRAPGWDACGKAERAIVRFETRRNAYTRRLPRKPRLMIIATSDDRRVSFLRNRNCIVEALEAVAEPVLPVISDSLAWLPASVEMLLAHDPDSLLVLSFSARPEETAQALDRSNRLWGALRAVRQKRVVVVRGGDALQFHSLPTMSRLLDTVAPLMHPDVFAAPLTDFEVMASPSG